MDCADWRRSGEDERRLLYVAMTRAKRTLTLMRAEGGRHPCFVDLGTVDSVNDTLSRQRPEPRPGIDLRYVTLGSADVDIRFAGRHGRDAPLHERTARMSPGDRVGFTDKLVRMSDGQRVGRLASKTSLQTVEPATGVVSGILVRTREQTPTTYQAGLRADRWESVLVELVLPRA